MRPRRPRPGFGPPRLTGGFRAGEVRDSFNRANVADGIGVTDTGHTWQVVSGTWGISSNQAYISGADATADTVYIESGRSDITVQVKIAASGGSPGLWVRGTDKNNALVTNLTALFRRQASVNNSILTFSSAISVGDTIRVVASGSTITVYRDAGSTGSFASVGSVSESFQQSSTIHGLRSSTNTGLATRFDDFRMF